ncbi:hypothetical protein [Veillonella agrestimuris]|uniref:hypothetical protein n=1 Tax=Veillonella agrestimuris TaxID=2941340 RepID=UPI00203E9F17|nr:hypothetical protein [Veillonella agrestimuris]
MKSIIWSYIKKLYSILWWSFLSIIILWAIIGTSYKFWGQDLIQKDRIELTQALQEYFPHDRYHIEGMPYDSVRRNLISKAVAINIVRDEQHSDISTIVPVQGEWTLQRKYWNYRTYESEQYIIYIYLYGDESFYKVSIAKNNWLEYLAF